MKKRLTAAVHLVLLFLSAISLPSCDSGTSTEAILKDYLTRIENATAVDSMNSGPIALLAYPSHRNRSILIEDIRLGVLDFIKLYDCDVFRLINERNSSLGRIMPVSQKLIYEIEFLKAVEKCHQVLTETSKTDGAFLEDLKDTIEVKKANLKKVFWNATFDSNEMQKAFSLAVAPLGPDDAAAYTNSRQAIEYFNRIGTKLVNPETTLDRNELEAQYYTLQLHQYGGRLAQSIAQLAQYLNAAAYSLETVTEDRSFCYQRKPTKKARILEAVLTKFYGDRVQPRLAEIHQQGKSWLDAVNRLIEIQRITLPKAFSIYRDKMLSLDSQDSLWLQFEEAIRRHTNAWQAILDRCGLTLGNEP